MDSITLLKEDIALLFEGNSIMTFISIGIAINIFYNIIHSFINYIYNKTWVVSDYEKIISKYINLNDVDNEDCSIVIQAHDNYNITCKSKEKKKVFINKIKKIFKGR